MVSSLLINAPSLCGTGLLARLDNASEDYRKAVELDPSSEAARDCHAWIVRDTEDEGSSSQ